MKKYVSKYDKNNAPDYEYINELKNTVELSQYHITEENYIDFGNLLESINNCKACMGLEYCKNNSNGYYKEVNTMGDEYYFSMKPCRYKENQLKEANSSQYLNTLYISKNVLNAKLSDYRLTNQARKKAFDYVTEFVRDYNPSVMKKGLCLCGPCGCGKTYLLSCLANELANKGISSLLIYVPDLVRDLKSAVGTPRLEEMMNMLKTIPVLILDDLGSEMMTQWVRDEIFSPLFNYRVMDEKPVFISTNLNPANLQKHFEQTNVDADNLKATRIINRLQSLVHVIKYEEI